MKKKTNMPFLPCLQTDDAVHVKPEEVHARQRVEQALVPVATDMGRLGPLGWPCQGNEDQGVLPGHDGRQPQSRTLPARRSSGAGQQGSVGLVILFGSETFSANCIKVTFLKKASLL